MTLSRAGAERATRAFFDGMSKTYDADLVDVGWDPAELVRDWPFIALPGMSVLDVGCGTGAVLERFAGAGRALAGTDLSPAMIARARKRSSLRKADLRVANASDEWPFPDGRFDRVLALAMLEFVEELEVALDELGRVLRSGGRALFTAEDILDWTGTERDRHELRYGKFPLWRRTRGDVEASLPPGLTPLRYERIRSYSVLELGFTTAYHVWEVERSAER